MSTPSNPADPQPDQQQAPQPAQPKAPGDQPQAAPEASAALTLPKAYDPSVIEARWAEYWTRERLFDQPTPDLTPDLIPDPAAGPAAADPARQPFTMLLPPPNVTGHLHMGHMLNHTEMDILARWHRMRGEPTLWVPGTDHAGIATQLMVERQLLAEGSSRHTLGREAFMERVWQWKQQYGSAITDQMRRLGASVAWSREYFTMDDRLSVAVREAFVRLWEQGLIYRGAYIVNWDPVQQTAVSDLEVQHEERAGKLYHIRYPFLDGPGAITIATTRPETLLGDVAIAVNPDDPRYRDAIGRRVRVPLTGVDGGPDRDIPILADSWANPEFGTGAVKVTPAHDPNDFAIGQRHQLPSLTILDEQARVALPGSPYHGLDRYDARARLLADLEAAGLLAEVRDHALAIAVSQRSGAVIEPRLSQQWFLAVEKTPASGGASIAANARAAVSQRHVEFTPPMYAKVYDEWMSNIHDWCLSRQLWWGHRIPAWHCAACSAITVARQTPAACSTCAGTDIAQSTDVLDTWFSSGLLPFTVFGWPGEPARGDLTPAHGDLTPDLAAFYPTSLLVTGFDILFFWVARMIMLGCHFMLEVPLPDGSPRSLAQAVPFRAVYIHGLVRDAHREKMSKTKGNVINPIEIVQRYGTDAVRFTLAAQASPGADIAFNEARTEGYRAFANKIWNAARFLFLNLDRARAAGIVVDLHDLKRYRNGGRIPTEKYAREPGEAPRSIPSWSTQIALYETIETRWIRRRLAAVAKAVHNALPRYRFDEAADAVYQFVWGDLCDWYLEMAKIRLDFETPAARDQATHALSTLVAVFEATLRLLSPFMPFLAEELWHALYAGHPPAKSIALTPYPSELDFLNNVPDPSADMDTLQSLITTVRALRKDLAVPEKESATVRLHAAAPVAELARHNADLLARLARVSAVEISPEALTGAAARSTPAFDVVVLYARQVDPAAERERLAKELARLDATIAANHARLADERFLAKAPAHIVAGLRAQTAELTTLRDRARAARAALDPTALDPAALKPEP